MAYVAAWHFRCLARLRIGEDCMTTQPISRTTLVDEFRRRLSHERERLLRTVAITDEELATLERHEPGGVTEDAAKELVTAILGRLEDRERHTIAEIDAALARLEAGTFGVCESCAQPIVLVRLRARPMARYCLGCQARQETAAATSETR
jgi:RNA polymerase-binding transcription factor